MAKILRILGLLLLFGTIARADSITFQPVNLFYEDSPGVFAALDATMVLPLVATPFGTINIYSPIPGTAVATITSLDGLPPQLPYNLNSIFDRLFGFIAGPGYIDVFSVESDIAQFYKTENPQVSTPEPPSWLLNLVGLIFLGVLLSRRRASRGTALTP